MDYTPSSMPILKVHESKVEKQRRQRSGRIYRDLVEPLIEEEFESRKIFRPDRIQEELRSPYSYSEVRDALEYATEHRDNMELLEDDMDLYLLTE